MAYPKGLYGTKFYNTWANIKKRCKGLVKESPNYKRMSIGYDPRWESFENFYIDMFDSFMEYAGSNRKNRNISIDRIDNTGGYSKQNCRWADPKTQTRNRSSNRVIEYNGIRKCLTDWAVEVGIKRSTLAQRYYVYKWDIAKCLNYDSI